MNQNEHKYIVANKNEKGKIISGIKWENINECYHDIFFDKSNIQIVYGGGSSGKSFMLAQRIVFDVRYESRNYLVARQIKSSLESSIYSEILKCIKSFGLEDDFYWRKNPLSITCKVNNRSILFAGLDNVESLKSVIVQDGTITDVFVEEATEIIESSFNQLRIRQRGVCYKKLGDKLTDEILTKRITLAFNPVSKDHWIYKRFFLPYIFHENIKLERYEIDVELEHDGIKTIEKETVMIRKTTYKDNRYLTKDDIIKLEGIKDRLQREVYVLGNFGVLGKTIFEKYTNWDIDDLTEIRKNVIPNRQGLDFGGSIDPHAFIQCYKDEENKIIYVLGEFKATDLRMSEVYMMIEPMAKKRLVICDAHDEYKKQMKELGLNIIKAKKGKFSVNSGIERLKEYKIMVDHNCLNFIEEMGKYTWKEDSYGNTLPIPIDKDNHLIDALRYAMSHDKKGKKVFKTNNSILR